MVDRAGMSAGPGYGGPMTTSPGDISLPRINDGGPVVVVEVVEIVIINFRPQFASSPNPSPNGDRSNFSDPGNVSADPTPRPVERTPAVTQEPPTDA